MLKKKLGSKEVIKKVAETVVGRKEESPKDSSSPILIPSGSTLLNLALSDTINGAYKPGTMVNLIGDSSSGKSFLAWTMFAEIARSPIFAHYVRVYDEPEHAFFMDMAKLFGLSEDSVTTDVFSDAIENWFINLMNQINNKDSFVYVLDSFDALNSNDEKEKIEELIKKGEMPGGYGTDKAKISGQVLRNAVGEISNTGSLLFIISQTRDKIGVMFGDKKTRSGGRALKFYATHEIWMAVKEHIKHKKHKDRSIGVQVIVKCKKNKLTGKERTIEFPILYDYGVDDITSMVEFLKKEGYWRGTEGHMTGYLGDEEITGSLESIVKLIEDDNLEEALKQEVYKAWMEIENSMLTNRKPKYGSLGE
jgi:recombination protein RecA